MILLVAITSAYIVGVVLMFGSIVKLAGTSPNYWGALGLSLLWPLLLLYGFIARGK